MIVLWKGYFTSEDVGDYIPCGSENKTYYSSIEWVDRCLIEMDTLGGNFFLCSCNIVFVLPDIALTWAQQKRSIMQPPYIYIIIPPWFGCSATWHILNHPIRKFQIAFMAG